MADTVDSVKSLAKLFRGWANSSHRSGDPASSARHTTHAELLEAVATELRQLKVALQPIPASYGDLSDLPPDLMKELSGIRADDLEQQLFAIIKSGEEVELDAILIELWRRFQVMQTRKFLQNKLWRMAQKGLIWTIPGRKGVYTAIEPPKTGRPQPASFDTDLDDDVPF